jgi:hypothetical protein
MRKKRFERPRINLSRSTRMKNRPETKQSLLERYNCGPVKLSGDSNAFYEWHVTFDQVVAETETTARDKFEVIASPEREEMLCRRFSAAPSGARIFAGSQRFHRGLLSCAPPALTVQPILKTRPRIFDNMGTGEGTPCAPVAVPLPISAGKPCPALPV